MSYWEWESRPNTMVTKIMFHFICHQTCERLCFPKNCHKCWRTKEEYVVRKERGCRQMCEKLLPKQCLHTAEQEGAWGHMRFLFRWQFPPRQKPFQHPGISSRRRFCGGRGLQSRRLVLWVSPRARRRLLKGFGEAVLRVRCNNVQESLLQNVKCQTRNCHHYYDILFQGARVPF